MHLRRSQWGGRGAKMRNIDIQTTGRSLLISDAILTLKFVGDCSLTSANSATLFKNFFLTGLSAKRGC